MQNDTANVMSRFAPIKHEFIQLDMIDSPEFTDRSELHRDKINEYAKSIEKIGLQSPIWVRIKDDGRFERIAGRHRIEATKILGGQAIMAAIYNINKTEARVLTFIENNQRTDVNSMDEAMYIANVIKERFVEAMKRTSDEFQDKHEVSVFSVIKNCVNIVSDMSFQKEDYKKDDVFYMALKSALVTVLEELQVNQNDITKRFKLFQLPKIVQDAFASKQISLSAALSIQAEKHKFLGYTNAEGKPTHKMEEERAKKGSELYSQLVKEAVEKSFTQKEVRKRAKELLSVFVEKKDMTREKIEDVAVSLSFENFEKLSKKNKKKMIALILKMQEVLNV